MFEILFPIIIVNSWKLIFFNTEFELKKKKISLWGGRRIFSLRWGLTNPKKGKQFK
jgi:hypothetical protein